MKLNTPKIDSLRLLIPLHEIEVNPSHSQFLRVLTTINEDGEILDSKKNNSYRLHSNPCSSTYLCANTIIRSQAVEVIKIGFSSKTLKGKYFEGITKENIDDIYNFILSEGVIKLSKETLMTARVVDVDVCTDVLLKDTTIKEGIDYIKALSVAHKETSVNVFNKENNRGIEFGDRNKVGESYLRKQYLKYYAKSLELKNNSTLFYNTYIQQNEALTPYLQDNHLLRIETTIKNSAHWNTYNLQVATLNDLLNLDLSNSLELFKRPISHYMNGSKFIETRTTLSPSDRKDLTLIDMHMKFYDLKQHEAIEHLGNIIEPTDRRHKARYIKKLEALVNTYRKNKIIKGDINQLNIIEELTKMRLIPTDK